MQAFQLASEVAPLRQHRIVKRLLPETIARQKNTSPAGVPDGISEHAAQAPQALGALFFVEMHERFGVAIGGEPVPTSK